MGIRRTVGSVLESAIGRERANTMRSVERRARNALVEQLAMVPPKRPATEGRATHADLTARHRCYAAHGLTANPSPPPQPNYARRPMIMIWRSTVQSLPTLWYPGSLILQTRGMLPQ